MNHIVNRRARARIIRHFLFFYLFFDLEFDFEKFICRIYIIFRRLIFAAVEHISTLTFYMASFNYILC